ncbi:MAG: hypothetical protein Q7S20_02175 [Gemmatimonadaceae bacterium]|nr:hypothetical protein [Gemmatimonadaceae bacterium]
MKPLRKNAAGASRAFILSTIAIALGATGCASGHSAVPVTAAEPDPGTDYRTRVYVEPVKSDPKAGAPRDTAHASAYLPGLMIAQISDADEPVRRIQLLDVVGKELPVVLRGLATSFGLNYQIDPHVRGSVNTRLQGVTLEQALDAIVLPQGYSYSIEGGVLQVGAARLQTRMFSLDYVALQRVGSTNTSIQRRLSGGGNQTANPFGIIGSSGGSDFIATYAVSDVWEELKVSLDGLVFDATRTGGEGGIAAGSPAPVGQPLSAGLSRGGALSKTTSDGRRLIINPGAGTILVTAPPAKLAEVATFISAFEGSIQRQVLIEAKIVQVTLSKESQFGIDWTALSKSGKLGVKINNAPLGGGGIQLTIGGGASQILTVLRALETQGDVSVLSSPRVATLNNERAVFNVTTDEVFFNVTRTPIIGPNGGTIGFSPTITPQQVSIGIVLNVLPQIGADNSITLSILPSITNVERIATIKLEDGSSAEAPVTSHRETDTMARVRDGETIVIGGLMQTRRDKTATGVPLLGSIPGIGWLFRGVSNKVQKDELVIFLTPTIIVGQPRARP